MSHPRNFLCLDSFPSPVSFLKKSRLSSFRGSDGCSGRNSVWMNNRAARFARSIQCLSSTVMVMMLLMNPSVDASVVVMSTANGSAVARCLTDCCLFSCGSKDQFGEFRLSVSQDSSRSISLPRSFAASLPVVYSAGAGVVSDGNTRQIKASSSTIEMHVGAVFAFACIRR